MTAVYAIPVSAVNPDDGASRARLSRGRLEQLDRRHGTARAQGFAASLLLEYAVSQQYPWVVHPLAISIADGGKPYLVSEPGIHFSLSHSGDWAVCALSDHPVGVDIERCEPGRRDIASRFFHREEVRYLNTVLPSARDDAFYKLWTLRRALSSPPDAASTYRCAASGVTFIGCRRGWTAMRSPAAIRFSCPSLPIEITALRCAWRKRARSSQRCTS